VSAPGRAVPHAGQNRPPADTAPHVGHIAGNELPHCMQNRARTSFSAWHDGHRITAADSYSGCANG
jgi:hypothetical protein